MASNLQPCNNSEELETTFNSAEDFSTLQPQNFDGYTLNAEHDVIIGTPAYGVNLITTQKGKKYKQCVLITTKGFTIPVSLQVAKGIEAGSTQTVKVFSKKRGEYTFTEATLVD